MKEEHFFLCLKNHSLYKLPVFLDKILLYEKTMSEVNSLHAGTLPQLDLKKSEQAKKATKAEGVSSNSIDPEILKKALIP